jgi:hypothetical protein
MIKWDSYGLEGWVEIFEAQSDQGLEESRWGLYDVASASAVGSPERDFAKRALSELGRIERRRALHQILRGQLLTRPDLSGDVLLEALVQIERLRLDLGGPGSFETDFTAAIEVAETRAATSRQERGTT